MNTPERVVTNLHNNPPSAIEELLATLQEKHSGFLTRAQELTDKANAVKTPTSEDEATAIGDLGKDISLLSKDMDALREKLVRPYLDGQNTVNGFFNPVIKGLDKLIAKDSSLRSKLTQWLQAKADAAQAILNEQARLAREKVDQEAEAAAKLAPVNQAAAEAVLEQAVNTEAKAIKLEEAAKSTGAGIAVVRGSGSSSSLTKTWTGTIVDLEKLDLNVLRPYIAQDALQTALNKFVKAEGRVCAGAKIEQVIDSRIR